MREMAKFGVVQVLVFGVGRHVCGRTHVEEEGLSSNFGILKFRNLIVVDSRMLLCAIDAMKQHGRIQVGALTMLKNRRKL